MQYLKKMNMVCLAKQEFLDMYSVAKKVELLREVERRGYTLDSLRADRAKMQEVVDAVGADHANDKEEIELFVALFSQLKHYPEGSQVCLILRDGLDPRKTAISTFAELKDSLKENEITDFAIMSDDGLRQFQLKQYKDKLTLDALFTFLQSKIKHYGGDLGDTNLLLILQSAGGDLGEVDLEELCTKLHQIGIKSKSEILLSLNEENKFDVIVRVFPTVGVLREPRKVPTII